MTRKQILSLVILGASVVYDAVPADLIPDIPLIGWLDDFFITSSAILNCVDQFSNGSLTPLRKAVRWLKWLCVLLAVLVVLLGIFLVGTICVITQ